MSAWIASLIGRFPPGVTRLWIAIDPDDVLLDEQLIAALSRAGFDLLDFDDPIVFRAEYEERYRASWEIGGSSEPALILRYRRTDPNELPWDYVSQARLVRLGLAELFPNLAYTVVKALEPRHLAQLYEAHRHHAPQPLGETATKDFILTHIFKISPVLITRHEDLWREILRCHYSDTQPPPLLTRRVAEVLSPLPQFDSIDVDALLSSKVAAIDALQQAWTVQLQHFGVESPANPPASGTVVAPVPFSHPDVRTIVDSMFLDGELQPVAVSNVPDNLPPWVHLGIRVAADSTSKLVHEALHKIAGEIPGTGANHRDWATLASRFGELQKRFHSLEYPLATSVGPAVEALRQQLDGALLTWLQANYSALPSLPIGTGPVVLSHIARYLAMKRTTGAPKVALVVFDGMAFDQWKLVKDRLSKSAKDMVCEEAAVFSWLPTLTSVCRQSIFSGLKPREFVDTIETTAAEEAHWTRFWLDHDVRKTGIGYVKGLKRVDQLSSLDHLVAGSPTVAQAIVVDAIDELVHGAVFGKRGVASQIQQWLETGFVEQLLSRLLRAGFQLFITSDHGNTDAIGIGRPRHGDVPELKGERTRVYRSELLRSQARSDISTSDSLPLGSLPHDYLPVFPRSGQAFVTAGERIVAHGGPSVEELLVPFVKVSYK
jgi:hypothetical protein